jgi:hypothetical protein
MVAVPCTSGLRSLRISIHSVFCDESLPAKQRLFCKLPPPPFAFQSTIRLCSELLHVVQSTMQSLYLVLRVRKVCLLGTELARHPRSECVERGLLILQLQAQRADFGLGMGELS